MGMFLCQIVGLLIFDGYVPLARAATEASTLMCGHQTDAVKLAPLGVAVIVSC